MKKSILSFILSLCCIVPLFAEEGIVQAASLNVRIRPGVKKPDTAVASVKKGEKVNIVGRDASGWLEIAVPEGASVWVYGTSLKDGTVVKEARLRSGPGLAYTAYRQTAKPGTKVEIIQKSNDNWIKIKTIPGMTAWVSGEFVKFSSAASSDVQAVLDRKEPIAADAKKTEVKDPPAENLKAKELPPVSADAKSAPAAAKKDEKTDNGPAQEKILGKTDEKKDLKDTKDADKDKTAKVDAVSKEKDAASAKPSARKKLTDVEIQKELKKLPFVKDSEKKVSLEGFLLPVNSENPAITHALAERTDNSYVPICYVHSLKLDLAQWENQKVKMEGTEKSIRGWQKPLVDAEKVTSLW